MSDMEVIKEHSVMLPMTMIRLLRLNLLIRLAVGSNLLLKAVVFSARNSQKSWLRAVVADFEWC